MHVRYKSMNKYRSVERRRPKLPKKGKVLPNNPVSSETLDHLGQLSC